MWSAADCAETAVLSGHTASVNSVSVSPGGEYVLTASDDKTVRVWSMKTGETLRELRGHADKVCYFASLVQSRSTIRFLVC